jgi:hypothetical protein
VFRRNERIRQKLTDAFRAAELPFIAPEIVLLFKAKSPTAIDETDFANVTPHLNAVGRSWLLNALSLCHPRHHWAEALAPEA